MSFRFHRLYLTNPAQLTTLADANLASANMYINNDGLGSLEVVTCQPCTISANLDNARVALHSLGFDLDLSGDFDTAYEQLWNFATLNKFTEAFIFRMWESNSIPGNRYTVNTYEIPFYIDTTRLAFYKYLQLVAEAVEVRFGRLVYTNSVTRRVRCEVHTFIAFVPHANVPVRMKSGFATVLYNNPTKPMHMCSPKDLALRPVYTYEPLGYEPKSVFADFLTYGPAAFCITSANRNVVFSNMHKPTPQSLRSWAAKRYSMGSNGMFYGMIPPVDADGRATIVLPVERFALASKEISLRRIVHKIDELTRLLVGEPPIWLTPAGRCTLDDIDF